MLRQESEGSSLETPFICIGQLDCAKAGSRKLLSRGFGRAEKGTCGYGVRGVQKRGKNYKNQVLQ